MAPSSVCAGVILALALSAEAFVAPGSLHRSTIQAPSRRSDGIARCLVAVGDFGTLSQSLQAGCEVAGTCLPAAAAAAKAFSAGAAAKGAAAAASTKAAAAGGAGAAGAFSLPSIHLPTAAEQAKLLKDITGALPNPMKAMDPVSLPPHPFSLSLLTPSLTS